MSTHLQNKIRRLILAYAKKGYVQDRLAVREGQCRQCGTCCKLVFRCPFLTKRGLCSIHDICQPLVCRLFPLDSADIEEIAACGGACGFAFKKD